MKRAVIVGSAPCVWDDLAAAPEWPLIVINAMGLKILGEIDLWCSIHGTELCERMKKRDRLGGDIDYLAYGVIDNPRIKDPEDSRFNRVHRGQNGIWVGGSSGMFAIQVALSLGYERLVLCGVPLDGNDTIQDDGIKHFKGGNRNKYGGRDPAYAQYQQAFIDHEEQLIPHVRSMSGWTKLRFGPPENGWTNATS